MQATKAGSFDFQILDMKRHRLAYCPRTGILSMSSASRGVCGVPEGKMYTEVEGIGKMAY